jgi:hypothetical protein
MLFSRQERPSLPLYSLFIIIDISSTRKEFREHRQFRKT